MMTPLLADYIDRQALAHELKVSARTIARYENELDGLPSLMVGRWRRYRLEAVRIWLLTREKRRNPRRKAA